MMLYITLSLQYVSLIQIQFSEDGLIQTETRKKITQKINILIGIIIYVIKIQKIVDNVGGMKFGKRRNPRNIPEIPLFLPELTSCDTEARTPNQNKHTSILYRQYCKS